MRRRVIINADDYGLSEGVSRGIREGYLHGIVRSSSVMMNMPGAEQEITKAMEETPGLGLGVHLNLTAGQPLSGRGKARSLVDATGRFFTRNEFIEKIESLRIAEVGQEWETQVDYFIEVSGNNPTHIDSHHHVSYFSRSLFTTMLELAERHQCPIRNVFSDKALILEMNPATHEPEEWTEWVKTEVKDHAVICPDLFISSFYDDSVSTEVLKGILKNLPDGVSEVMCHPGYADEKLELASSYVEQRELELKVLTNPEVLRLVKDNSIELISFRDLVEAEQ